MERIIKAYQVLLLKCQGAIRVGGFWPNLLSSSIYLIIVKVQANRVSEVPGEQVVPFQSTFIQADSWRIAQSWQEKF